MGVKLNPLEPSQSEPIIEALSAEIRIVAVPIAPPPRLTLEIVL